MYLVDMKIANTIAAFNGGNGKHVLLTDASGNIVAFLKSIGTTNINGEPVAVVKLSATSTGLIAMTRMGHLSNQPHGECSILVRTLKFEQNEFTRWIEEYHLPENSTAILAPINCAGVIALNKPLPVNIDDSVTTANWCGIIVFGPSTEVMQLAHCKHIDRYVLLNHSMKTCVVIPDFLLSKELPYSDQNFEHFVHSEVLSDYSTEVHPFSVIM